jgi:hypothetical protein
MKQIFLAYPFKLQGNISDMELEKDKNKRNCEKEKKEVFKYRKLCYIVD